MLGTVLALTPRNPMATLVAARAMAVLSVANGVERTVIFEQHLAGEMDSV